MSRMDSGHFIPYEKLAVTLEKYRKSSPGKLTLAEKILYAHLDNPNQQVVRGKTYLNLRPDRVAMQVCDIVLFFFFYSTAQQLTHARSCRTLLLRWLCSSL